jgi:hypothetical protein
MLFSRLRFRKSRYSVRALSAILHPSASMGDPSGKMWVYAIVPCLLNTTGRIFATAAPCNGANYDFMRDFDDS